MTTDQPTIAAVWAAFVALSAAWDAKHNGDSLLQFRVWADEIGWITVVFTTSDKQRCLMQWGNFADALTAIEAARAGLEG